MRIAKHEGQSFIVMEFLEGMTLKYRIAGRPLRPITTLKRCHSASTFSMRLMQPTQQGGIIHRDIKPANIRNRMGTLRSPDFGLAKVAPTASSSSQVASANTMTGTIDEQHLDQSRNWRSVRSLYVPEQAKGG